MSLIDRLQGAVGSALVALSREAFETGGPAGAWPATAWPRLAELIADLDDGVVRDRTLERSHQTGVGTGALRNSIHWEPSADGVALVIGGGEVDYAQRFVEGGEHTLRVDQAGLRRWYRDDRRAKPFVQQHGLGWLFAKQSVTFRSPARPLFTLRQLLDTIEDEVREIAGAAR